MSTSVIGTIYCEVQLCNWDVHSDGKAYADTNEVPYCAYRWPDGGWRPKMAPPYPFADRPKPTCDTIFASEDIEALFKKFVNDIIVGPVDPHRHLK